MVAAASLWWFGADREPPPALDQARCRRLRRHFPAGRCRRSQFLDTNGKRVTFADFKGRPVLLNVWAKWCACVIELPKLDHLQAKINPSLLAVVTVAVDEPDPRRCATFSPTAAGATTHLSRSQQH